jgi:hypothetical protein
MYLASKAEAHVQLATVPGPDGVPLGDQELLESALDFGIQMAELRLQLLGYGEEEIQSLTERYRAFEDRMQAALAEIGG